MLHLTIECCSGYVNCIWEHVSSWQVTAYESPRVAQMWASKRGQNKILRHDKWNYLNCISYIFHDIRWLRLQSRPKLFCLLNAFVAGLYHTTYRHTGHTHIVPNCTTFASTLISVVGGRRHSFTKDGNCASSTSSKVARCVSSFLPNIECDGDAHIPENKDPFGVLLRALGFESISFTLPSWHFSFSSDKWIPLLCIINLWGFMVFFQNFYDLGGLCYDCSDLKCLQITD